MEKTHEASKHFSKLLKINQDEKLIIFDDWKSVGFSILKEYPNNIPFISPKTSKGINDAVALIRVAFSSDPERKTDNGFPLHIDISKASKYLLEKNQFDYNFDDENSPTKESLKVSKATRRPTSLE